MPVATASYAFDKQSARSYDADGRMRVRGCTISVAEVNPYYGREIPGWKELGLDPDRVYDMYRDPDALAMAADSFNGLPLMIRHIAQTAADPRKEHVGGSVYNVRFEKPILLADLLVSDGKAIEYVKSEVLADLSSSYRYKPDMTPGEVDGRKFDGRMLAIDGNHVALVEDGRATGAHVADSALSSQTGAPNVDPNETNPAPVAPAAGNAEMAQALIMLTEKLEAIDARLAALETPGGEEPATVIDPPSALDEDSDKDDKPAMDAQSVQAVVDAAVKAERARAAATESARRACRADLGDMIAMDSAPDIYRAALKQRGVNIDAIPEGAEQAAYEAIQAVSTRPAGYAADSRSSASTKRVTFDTSRIKRG